VGEGGVGTSVATDLAERNCKMPEQGILQLPFVKRGATLNVKNILTIKIPIFLY